MKNGMTFRRILSVALVLALVAGYIPTVFAATPAAGTVSAVADPGTASNWETMMGTDADGNRYAGRVWVDKSVYVNGDTAVLNTSGQAGSSFQVNLEKDEAFQIVFSALGSTMTTTETSSTTGPMDVVLVLDTSTSMDDEDRQGVTRLQRVIEASNKLLSDLLEISNVRIAIVTYNNDSETVLPLASYENGVTLKVANYYNNGRAGAGVVTAYDASNKVLGNDSGYTAGTNLQSGIDRGFNILANATDVAGRVPVAIVLTDGQANRASQEGFYEIQSHSDKDGTSSVSSRNLYLSTLLNAAYNKTKIEANYGSDATVYTVGVDITTDTAARLLMNPADNSNKGFNSSNTSDSAKKAYENFLKWKDGQTVTYNNWTFDHNYPTLGGKITDAAIADNIYYVDTYYDVSSENISTTFDQIYEELSSGVFNPISSSTSVSGGTGVEKTPLIFVDFIGQHMQVKKIQSITLFGASYGVIQNADGTYTVEAATGTNPTTNERWNTAEDIRISVTQETADTQRLEIEIDQEILPIILEQVDTKTVGKETTSTITEVGYQPLRVFYTVGVSENVLLPNGEVDVSKLQGYGNVDNAAGTVDFYSNRYGDRTDAPDGIATTWNSHVGFQPAAENRYYYHQSNQGIFTGITNKQTGESVTIPENAEYGIVWDDQAYTLSWMTYAEYLAAKDTDRVYTYVTYYHPTPSLTDNANAAEEVTYLIYADWGYLKESAAFYDATAGKYVNDNGADGYVLADQGVAIGKDNVAAVIGAYTQANPGAAIYAVLGVGSVRTSRLHNMDRAKSDNLSGTNELYYEPEYTHETANDHHGNSVVVWLGNNGRLTVSVDTGIALTKAVTEAFGNANDTYELTVTVPAGVEANPVAVDENGNAVESTYADNVLTVKVKAGQTVYVNGIPGGTECAIGENIKGDYYIADKTATIRVPLVSEVLNGADQYAKATVTNAPYKYGNLYINKAIASDHPVPESVLQTQFPITVNLGAALAGKTLTVEDSAHTAPYEVVADENGNLYFSIKATQTLEIFNLPLGTNVTVTETDPGSHFAVTYGSRNHSGEALDGDNAVVIPANGAASVVITNRYTPEATTVDLDVEINKNFADASAAAFLEGGQFTFRVLEYDAQNGKWNDTPVATTGIAYGAGEYGAKVTTIENVLNGKTFTKVGTYSYKVEEVKGNVTNVSYDRAIFLFDVVVTDNGGALTAVVMADGQALTDSDNDGSAEFVTSFRNTYDTAPISMDIQKIVVNKSGDATVSAAGFKFKSMAVDAEGNPLASGAVETAINTIYSDAAGVARISGAYTREQIGTHYYIVYEENTAKAGWTSYSQAQYFVTVVVADQEGKLVATMTIAPYNAAAEQEAAPVVNDNNKGQITFTNVYDPADVSVDLDAFVRKELTGKTLTDGQFTFYVYPDGDRTTPLLTGTNKRNGDVNFVDFNKELTFNKVGKFAYNIVESIPEGAVYDEKTGEYVLGGMRYDATIYDLVVEVTNDQTTGKLVYRCYFEDAPGNVVTFHNRYMVSATQYALGGAKVLRGRAPRAGEFRFSLYKGDQLLETVSNKADGSFQFSPISYEATGDYVYTIREEAGSVPGVTYTGVDAPVTVTVSVTDAGGQLKASANKANAQIRFENSYNASPAGVTFTGNKTLVGGAFQDGDFTFRLYQTDASFDINGATWSDTAGTKNGVYAFYRTFTKPGTFFFVVAEDAESPIADVVYDRTQYRFSVQVFDLGDGQLRTSVNNITTGVQTLVSSATVARADFVNAVTEEVTDKQVYYADSTVTHIDGKKVQKGDVLTYFITYTNYTGEDVVADIMDTIPAYTSYVEGSASHNATYAGTHLNWILNMARGESVTVSFNVKVDEDEAIFTNTAIVRDGVNVYHTNEVVNHTVNRELKKDVFLPDDASVSMDGKKVYPGDTLVYQLSFTNASGVPASVTIADTIPQYTSYVEGSANGGAVYADGTLTWNLQNIPAWETAIVTFKVTVDAEVGAVLIQNQATGTDGVNEYQSQWVINYTVEDEVTKAVANVANPDVVIDGQKVGKGTELVYYIAYKNTAREAVTVTITDIIPQHTTYVEGSADTGGVYADGTLTWNVTVEPGETTVVSFRVKVGDGRGAAITNTATATDGRNTYTTNTVSNPTDKPVPPGPITGDNSNVQLWYGVMFVSCLGLAVLVLTGKKKEETV